MIGVEGADGDLGGAGEARVHGHGRQEGDAEAGATVKEALERIGEWVRDHSMDGPGPYRAARDFLLRRPPRAGQADGTDLVPPGESVDRVARRLRAIVNDPDSNFSIDVGRIQWSDLTGDVDLQYVLPQGRTVTAYLGAGLSVHVMNGSGAAINGTFVEDALDGVAAGLNGTLGFEIATSPAWRFTLEARGVLSTQLSTGSLRAGVMYRLSGKR